RYPRANLVLRIMRKLADDNPSLFTFALNLECLIHNVLHAVIVDNSLHFVKKFSRFVLKGLATHVYNSLFYDPSVAEMLLDAPDSRGSKRPFCTAPIFHPEDRERQARARNADRAATEGLSRCSDRFPRALRTCPGPQPRPVFHRRAPAAT